MDLNINALLESGWRPTPFQQFVLKIHSRCNLACTYCYMYEMADQGWRRQPRRMSQATIDAAAARIAEHAQANNLSKIDVILHGGEPLLAGAEHIRHAVETIRRAAGAGVTVNVQVQTNGVLLDPVFLETFADLGVLVAVSLDGDREANDRHRLGPAGQGSYDRVHDGLAQLTSPAHRHLFNGLLCTIDLRNDPVGTYEALLAHAPPTIDFLLPHGTWETPPPGRHPDREDAPYGDWLIAVFDRWYHAPRRETRVRLFDEIIRLVLGRPSRSEAVGLSAVAVVVVETDGGIEQVDSLKSAYDGATRTPLHVSTPGAFDTALMLPSIAARQIGERALSPECRACDIRRVCGAGLYPHRYRPGTGFANPSVYCRDLFRLITHIQQTVNVDLAAVRDRSRRRRLTDSAERHPDTMTLAPHSLPKEVFFELAAGRGGRDAVERLWAAQDSKRLLLLRGVRDLARDDARVRQAYELLADIQEASPEVARQVLRYPTAGSWGLRTLQALGGHTSPAPWATPSGLASLAAVAAIRSGRGATIEVPVLDGAAVLPSLGRALFDGDDRFAVVRTGDGEAEITAGGVTVRVGEGPSWEGLRRIRAAHGGLTAEFVVDDLDPGRMPGAQHAEGRLSAADLHRWESTLQPAWEILADRHPQVAEEIAAVVTVLTPLAEPAHGTASATSKLAFGNIGISTQPDPHAFAVTLAHESQHAKLSGLLDLIPLTQPDDGSRYYAPWRDDPRPLGGLLHGAYAHLAIAAFWGVERQQPHEDELRLRAHTEFARWRDGTDLTIRTLRASGRLTPEGDLFTAEMAGTMAAMCAQPVPPEAAHRAGASADRHLAGWRRRNGEPPAGRLPSPA
ncbi:FxsB family radical SAM/SPASM domain protein [Actinomadura sp. ATCC 31491]|uniref:FxsB family radical SAM/SPASM domain protein n=1 Tax=Actinomadura luzonensis TaxID=2805427 RepID=A0ABT0FPS2_9ACTN|nr:FxsB family cyclophane-forming radical SAM/SPASM peptide maturase [Actinomadura luzonensis]MCK2214324.1 FxsB family radical SAM/SPASM domain protein [Actinomadura luzonensis]